MRKCLNERILERVLLYDGSKGVMLQKQGLKGSESAEGYNLSHPDLVSGIYESYIEAGSDLIQTNTFQANRISLEKHGLSDRFAEINKSGVQSAVKAAGRDRVAVSAGPTSLFFEPLGEMSFEDAAAVFAEQARVSEQAGAKIINFETFTDLAELRAAVIGAKENTELDIIANATFDETGRTLMGNPADVCALTLMALGASIVGANCSGGPESLLDPIRKMHELIGGPLCVKPNAGMPEISGGETVFSETPEHFASFLPEYIKYGVRLIGGCCGTTPEHIAKMRETLDGLGAAPWHERELPPVIASPYGTLSLSEGVKHAVLSFGEQALREALLGGDFDEINDCALGRAAEGADCIVIDFSDLPDESDLWGLASNLVMAVRLPVIAKGADAAIRFLRYYPGRCGYAAPNEALGKKAAFYGALILDERLRPVSPPYPE